MSRDDRLRCWRCNSIEADAAKDWEVEDSGADSYPEQKVWRSIQGFGSDMGRLCQRGLQKGCRSKRR